MRRKAGLPMRATSAAPALSGLKFFHPISSMVVRRIKGMARTVALTTLESAVAPAAPATPQPKTLMNSGSRPMFSTQPETMPIMAKWVLPSLRRSWFWIISAVVKGAASKIQKAYCMEYIFASRVTPRRSTMGERNTRHTSPKARENAMPMNRVLDPTWLARLSSFAPRSREI